MTRRKTTPLPQQSPIEAALTAILADTVRLDKAACVGRSELFDPPGDSELRTAVDARHRAAAHICWTCPVIDSCRDWAASEPASDTIIAAHHMSPNSDLDKVIQSDVGESEPRNEQTA